MLLNYHEKMEKISKIVNVLYCNIDSILITESDFKKLEELGYINDELGGLKVEHIFTEFVIKSTGKWIGKLEKEKFWKKANAIVSEIKSRVDLTMSFEELVHSI